MIKVKKIVRIFFSNLLYNFGEFILLLSYKISIFKYQAYQPVSELKISSPKRNDRAISNGKL